MKTKKPKKGFLDGYKTYDTSSGFGSRDEWRYAFRERMSLDEATEVLGDKDPLDILELHRGASMAEVKRAYRAACMKYHPDRPGGNAEMFKRCHAAYIRLGGR
jgi:DnaJ-domain-containing protein 1